VTTYYVMVGLAFVVGISLLGIDVIKILAENKAYWEAYQVLPAVCYSFFLYGFSQVIRIGCLIKGQTFYITITMCVGLVFNLALNYIFIRSFGYSGSAYALLATFVIITALSYIFSSRLYRIRYDAAKMLQMILFSFFTIGIGMWSATFSTIPGLLTRLFLISIFLSYIYIFQFSSNEKKQMISGVKCQFKSIFNH